MNKPLPYRYVILLLVVCLGLRLAVADVNAKYNYVYDFRSYKIVSAIQQEGGNVYQQTSRYNYAPVWMNVLHGLSRISQLFDDSNKAFRYLIVLLLALVDSWLVMRLYRYFGWQAAVFLLFHPISILITGFQSMFDNMAILCCLLAIPFLGLHQEEKTKSRLKFYVGLGLLGLSLCIKHVFFLFPLWLFFRPGEVRERLAALVIPPAIFLVSFTPYLLEGYQGIWQNVFFYSSYQNAPFLSELLPPCIGAIVSPRIFFFGGLAAVGWLYRYSSMLESMLYYTGFLLVFSSAIERQYLAIPLILVCSRLNVYTVLYSIGGAAYIVLANFDVYISKTIWAGATTFRWHYGNEYLAMMVVLLLAGMYKERFNKVLIFALSHFRSALQRQLNRSTV